MKWRLSKTMEHEHDYWLPLDAARTDAVQKRKSLKHSFENNNVRYYKDLWQYNVLFKQDYVYKINFTLNSMFLN